MRVKKRNGRLETLNVNKINNVAQRACKGLTVPCASEIILDAQLKLFDKITTAEIDTALIQTARDKGYKDPEYSTVAARLLLNCIYKEVFKESVDCDTFEADYKSAFIRNVKKQTKEGRLDQRNVEVYDLKKLSNALVIERDDIFSYFALRNINDRYLLRKNDGKIFETPQAYYMRIAMGLCYNEENPEEMAINLYNLYSTHRSSPSTPTLFNSATSHNQLSSCYLSEIDDSVDGIFDGLWQEARKSKYAGGLGFHVTKIRAMGAHIKGTNGRSSGLIPWLKVYNDMLIACDQAGKRQGSGCAYLEPWHLDIHDFIDLKKETGEERRRCHDLNTALWCPDIFFTRVKEGGQWTLFCPSETPDLPDLYGEEFNKRYVEYEEMAKNGEIKNYKEVEAKVLWKEVLRSLFETSHPWITHKDNANMRYSNIHEGVLHGSNLCCVTGDQRLPTQFGLLTARELAEKHPNDDLMVVGRDGIESATPMALTIPNTPVLKVVTSNGYEHKVTYDHPLWVVDKGWVEAQSLKIGDKVEIQKSEGLWGKDSFPEEAFLMGLIAGDGTYMSNSSGDSICIDIWENDFDYTEEVEKCVNSVLQKHIKDYNQLQTSSVMEPKLNLANSGISNVLKKRLVSRPLSKILSTYGFTKETKTHIPKSLWRGDKETMSAYFRGRYIADGTIQVNQQYTTSSLASNNEEFIKDAQIILSNFGVKSHINLLREDGENLLPDGKGGLKKYAVKKCYRLCVTSKYCNKILDDQFGVFKDRGVKIEAKRPCGFYNVRMETEIKEVVKMGHEDTYCLKVLTNNDHAWTCNGLVTKNTEIFLHTKHSEYKDGEKTKTGETAVCNLASVVLPSHVHEGEIQWEKLAETVELTIKGLNNVIDINFYPTKEAEKSNLSHRPIGLGTMGFADLCYLLNIVQDSDEGVELADKVAEFVSYHAIYTSSKLAKAHGSYSSYEGSKWSQGIFPIDTYNNLMRWKDASHVDHKERLDWTEVRAHVAEYGMRNCNTMAIAPNASIAYQMNCTQSIEPDYKVLFVYENKSGNNYLLNTRFVNDMKKEDIWNDDFSELLREADGDVAALDIPDHYKNLYRNAFDKDQRKLIEANAARQKWIDMGISFNSYYNGTSLKHMNELYVYSNELGLKSNYYLRNTAASKIAKSTLSANSANKGDEQPTEEEVQACSIDAMMNGGSCEMCQG
jgi:ribonucleoside-diphosphate reductase alpha chain